MTSRTTIPTEFDHYIKVSSETYLPTLDWRLLKAQYWIESRLDPLAKSPAGAQGIAQFMPGTWEQVCASLPYTHLDICKPLPSIAGGAWYMAYLMRQWHLKRPAIDRHRLALASYNAGLGHILQAQVLSDGKLDYARIIQRLPEVTGRHATETINYAPGIWQAYIEIASDHAE